MDLGIDIWLYVLAAILFGFAGFDVTFGKPQPWSLRWDALAWMVLVISLII